MPLPAKVKEAVEQAYASLLTRDRHFFVSSPTLDLDYRIAIYQSFGLSTARKEPATQWQLYGWDYPYNIPLNFSNADKVFNWLAIITAEKVILIWQDFAQFVFIDNELESNNPQRMLDAAKDFGS